ncbi:MAG: restriction system protein, partial [Reinekea sp.]
MNIWGIHMGEKVGASPIDNKYIAIGWHQLGNLDQYANSRDELKDALSLTYPNIKKGAIPQNAGVLFRFVNEMREGDIVVYPSKDRDVNIGRIVGEYIYVEDNEYDYPNQRAV